MVNLEGERAAPVVEEETSKSRPAFHSRRPLP